jgi:peptide methionine sulfoxide reductase MsrA
MERVNAKLASNVFRKVLGSKVVTELQPAGDYYIAEKYHQQVCALKSHV